MNNRNWNDSKLEKDEEFIFLIQSSSLTSYEKLQDSLLNSGCHSPILVWNKFIVDGHKRYDICRRWKIPFKIKETNFQTRSEVYYYICCEQLKREDLTREMRKYLIGRAYQAQVEKNVNIYIRSNEEKDKQSHPFVPAKAYKKQDISHTIGQIFHIAPGTVLKYDTYAKIINELREKDPIIVGKILSGKVRVSHENMVELNRLPSHEIRSLNQYIMENSITHIDYSTIRQGLQWKYTYPKTQSIKKMDSNETIAKIKQMPTYDPDSTLASINLTIPSWINIIDHARLETDFLSISETTKKNSISKLNLLKAAIQELEARIKEDTTNGQTSKLCSECSLRANPNKEPSF